MRMTVQQVEQYLKDNKARVAQTRTMQLRSGEWVQVVSVATPEMGEKEGWIILDDTRSPNEDEAMTKGYEALFDRPMPEDEVATDDSDDLGGVRMPDGNLDVGSNEAV